MLKKIRRYLCGWCYKAIYCDEKEIKNAICPCCGRKGNWFIGGDIVE